MAHTNTFECEMCPPEENSRPDREEVVVRDEDGHEMSVCALDYLLNADDLTLVRDLRY